MTQPGTWQSPISAADVARSELALSFPMTDGDEVWWQEGRPEEDGRVTVMHRAPGGARTELVPPPYSARTRVHEYGGRSYLPIPGGLIFCNFADQRLYRVTPDASPEPITPDDNSRYADLILHGGEIWCVREELTDGKVRRSIAAVPTAGGDPREVVAGGDFYASPRPSPDGTHLAYITWNHPRMPWDGTELRVARIGDDGTAARPRTIKGGPGESVLAPTWRDGQSLYVVSDWSGWWNLYLVPLYGEPPSALYPAEEEFAGPLWKLGGTPYAPLADGRLAVVHGRGRRRLGLLDPDEGTLTDLDVPYAHWDIALSAHGTQLTAIGAGPKTPATVVRIETATGRTEALRRAVTELPDVAFLPDPEEMTAPSPTGRDVYAYVYPPANPSEDDARQPYPRPFVIFIHGGPTGQVAPVLDLEKAYFTSRGLGVADVNYGGSTGYGRSYRERLRHQWGVVDVEDAAAVAEELIRRGLTEPGRVAIRGGSAGGWTTVAAAITSDVFAAGTARYPAASAEGFAATTHDFESRYIEGLVGPRNRVLYGSRDWIARASEAKMPLLLLQGLDDPICVPGLTEELADALRVPHALLTFEGESHGFRRESTIVACLEAELSFYGQVLGFEPSGVTPLTMTH